MGLSGASEVRWIIKIVLCGPSMVGKTCLCTRYVNGVFAKGIKQTIGVDFALKNVTLEQGANELSPEAEITLQLWDFAGEERFRNVLPLYVGGTQGLLLSFDLNRAETLRALPQWLEVIHPHIESSVPIILVGMKSDLESKTSQQEINEFLRDHNIEHFIATSSLTGHNVEEAFTLVAREVLKNKLES
ncbi:MAG: Rab family GTPase [Candidatus Hodarchaeota archaeon]